jgi:8-oxo-dGTP diphosphatase
VFRLATTCENLPRRGSKALWVSRADSPDRAVAGAPPYRVQVTLEPAVEGCQIILVDDRGSVLLQLRDDKDSIPYPNMWAVPGGMLEPGETPLDAIVREVHEELGVELAPAVVTFLETARRSYGVEHTFTAHLSVPAAEIALTEGQRVEWFSPEQVAGMHLAYEDDDVLAAFFAGRCGPSTTSRLRRPFEPSTTDR